MYHQISLKAKIKININLSRIVVKNISEQFPYQ